MKKIKDKIYFIYFYFYFYFFRLFSKKVIKKEGDKENITIGNNDLIYKIPKIIWIFWFDENIPELVKKCIDRIILKNPQYNVKLLNKNNIHEYIDIDILKLKDMMPIANLSDLIRLKLLNKYGGIWADASIIVNKNFDDFFTKTEYKKDFLGFYNAYQSEGTNIPIIESWLIAAPSQSVFIAEWLKYFAPIEQLGSRKYFEKLKSNSYYKVLSQGLSNPEYLVVYMAAKLAYLNIKNKNLILYPCDNSAFLTQIQAQWRIRKCVVNLYMIEVNEDSPIHKLTSGDRKYYDFLMKKNLISKKSIMGKFLLGKNNEKI